VLELVDALAGLYELVVPVDLPVDLAVGVLLTTLLLRPAGAAVPAVNANPGRAVADVEPQTAVLIVDATLAKAHPVRETLPRKAAENTNNLVTNRTRNIRLPTY